MHTALRVRTLHVINLRDENKLKRLKLYIVCFYCNLAKVLGYVLSHDKFVSVLAHYTVSPLFCDALSRLWYLAPTPNACFAACAHTGMLSTSMSAWHANQIGENMYTSTLKMTNSTNM